MFPNNNQFHLEIAINSFYPDTVSELMYQSHINSPNILRRKANWIGRILRRNCLLRDAIGQMTEVKGVGRRRRTQLLDDPRNRRRYCELKEEAEDRKDEMTVYDMNIGKYIT